MTTEPNCANLRQDAPACAEPCRVCGSDSIEGWVYCSRSCRESLEPDYNPATHVLAGKDAAERINPYYAELRSGGSIRLSGPKGRRGRYAGGGARRWRGMIKSLGLDPGVAVAETEK